MSDTVIPTKQSTDPHPVNALRPCLHQTTSRPLAQPKELSTSLAPFDCLRARVHTAKPCTRRGIPSEHDLKKAKMDTNSRAVSIQWLMLVAND